MSNTIVSSETENDNLVDLQEHQAELADRVPPKKHGKPVNPIWNDVFDQEDVQCIQSPNNAVCRHCKESVQHHHKKLSVETHLRKCKPFKKIMMDMAVCDRPEY